MPATERISHFIVKIGGSVVSEDFMKDMNEVVVDSSLHLPDMVTIRLHDPYLKWVDDSLLDIGKEVEISVKTGSELGGQDGEASLLFKGEITALEPHFASGGATSMTVRGYDKSHRLHRGRQTRTWLETTDTNLAQTIAGEAGLSPEVDVTNVTYDYVLQNNQTNMEFLLTRAERIGYQVFAADGKLYFKKGTFSQSGGPELKYGENLISFQPCWTASGQTDKMVVKGWDPEGKTAISQEKTPVGGLNQGGMTQPGGDTAEGAFGSAEAVITDRPVFAAAEATALAEGLSHDISREFVQAEGECDGHPGVKAGWQISIDGVGTRFKGDYFVTSAMHTYTSGSYKTRFSITGRQPNTLSHLLESGNGHGQSQGLVQGVVTGLVTNLNDPDNLGRVKVKYAWLGEIESYWVRIATPMAGAERGFFYLPEVNDEVLIAFEHGDGHRPYIIGYLWSSEDKPPEKNDEVVGDDGKVNRRVISSRSGHVIVLNDTADEEQIYVESMSGHKVILDDNPKQPKITICDNTGKNEIVIDSKQNSVSITEDGDYSNTAKGKVTIDSTGNATIQSKGNITVKATGNLNLEATGNVSIKGAMVAIEGQSTTSVKGNAMVEIQGGLVKIN